MIQGLPPHFIDLVQDALLKSFWTKVSSQLHSEIPYLRGLLIHEGWHGNEFTRCLRATE